MRIITLYRRNPAAAFRAVRRHSAGKPPITFGHAMPDIHNTNPLAPARLTITVETAMGPRTVVTSLIDRKMASAIAHALTQRSVIAAINDDRGTHTVADLVKRKREREKQVPLVLEKPNAEVFRLSGRGKP